MSDSVLVFVLASWGFALLSWVALAGYCFYLMFKKRI